MNYKQKIIKNNWYFNDDFIYFGIFRVNNISTGKDF